MRLAAVVLPMLAVAAVAMRSAAVTALADAVPAAAARVWSGHPDAVIGVAMEEIGRAAAQGGVPRPASLRAIATVARKAPLAPEPFLVRGITAQLQGDATLAERAFLAARTRAPREPAPRYFLAQQYLVTGRSAEGLKEIATLARLIPTGASSLAPTLAAYARTPGAVPQLRALFRSEPRLARSVLAELAKDADNAELVLSLAEPAADGGSGVPTWARQLVQSLVADGQFARGRVLWARTAGVAPGTAGLFDPDFRGSDAPPPFNWDFGAAGAGLAEPVAGGGLRVLFYGREDGVLARQLLLLDPGAYTLSLRVGGDRASRSALGWSVECVGGNPRLLDLPLRSAGDGGLARGDFRVPASGCPAQWLLLNGKAQEVVRQADVTLSGLGLRRSGR